MKISQPTAMTVYCGDVHGNFSFGTKWSPKELSARLTQLKQRYDFVPGLVFQDERGLLWRPTLDVTFEQVIKPEEENG